MGGQVGGTESRPRVRPEIAQTPALDRESGQTEAAPRASQDYRGIKGDKEYAAPETGFKTYGPELAGLQNDLFNASYYPSRDTTTSQSLDQSYKKEVDRKFGPRTKAAVSAFQDDLKAAGLYAGDATGRYDAATHKAVEQLRKGAALSGDLQAEQRSRLEAFRGSAAQQLGPERPRDGESTFAPATPQAPPIDLTGGAAQPQKPLMGAPPRVAAAPVQSPVQAPVQGPATAPEVASTAVRPTSQVSKIDEERLAKVDAYVRKNYPQYLDRSKPDFESNLRKGMGMVNSRPGLFRWAFSKDADLSHLTDDQVRNLVGQFTQRMSNP